MFIDDGDSNTLDPDSNLKNTTNGIIVEGFLSASGGITSSGAHIRGDISGSGTITFGTQGAGQTHLFYGRIRTIGSEVSIGEGHITMSGNISGSVGSTGSFDHIITSTGSIEFRQGGTKIGDLKFDPDTGLQVSDSSRNPTKLKAGEISTPILTGEATGDQSGSLYMSGSITFRDNEAIPAVSASTLYNNNGHLYHQKQIIGGYHLSASADNVGVIKILPTGWDNNDNASYQRILFEDDSNVYGIKPGSTSHDLYKAIDIPNGWIATKYMIYSNASRDVDFIVVNMTNGTGNTDGASATANTECTLNLPYTSTSDSYALLKYNPSSTADIIYGGYVVINRA